LYEEMMAMDRIIEAKEKAERFLFGVVEQQWAGIIKDTHSLEFRYNALDWPFRFEAHAYLANRYRKHARRFARELQTLWLEWIGMHGKEKPEEAGIFWQLEDILPTVETMRGCFTLGSFMKGPLESKSESSPWQDVDVDMLVSMYRVKETLSIQGFDTNFAAALRGFIKWLSVRDVFSLTNNRIIWQICRSPALRTALEEIIRLKLVPRVRREIEEEEDGYNARLVELKSKMIIDTSSFLFAADVYLWAKIGFFFLLNNLGADLNSAAKEMALNLVSRQRENGSFNDDVITTSLAASCIHLAGIQKAGVATTEKAVEWLLQQQERDGSWSSVWIGSDEHDFVGDPDWIPGYSRRLIADHAQTTVIVLETIDLIKKIEPLPIWSVTTKGRVLWKDKEPQISPFSIPEDSSWNDVSIRFLKRSEDIEVKVGKNPNGVWNFAALGFAKKKAKGPDIRWGLLRVLAGAGGEISWAKKGRSIYKKNISLLRIKLKELFETEDDPFCPYQKCRSYKARFTILPYVDTDDDIRSESETLNSLRDDIEKKELMHHRKIQSANYREVKGLDREEEDS
jgi:hypothetical protein